jgi:DNA polymerase-3 subunit alpha
MIEARRAGKFTSFFDFVSRIDQGAIGRRGLESLVTSGCFDSFKSEETSLGQWRASLFAGIDLALALGQQKQNDLMRGQNALFGDGPAEESGADGRLPEVEPWGQTELSRQEKASIGFYLSIHPLDDYKTVLDDLAIRNIGDYEEIKAGDLLTLAGIVSGAQVRYSKKGNRFCMFRLEDQSTGVKCLAWSEAFGKFGNLMQNDRLLIVDGRVEAAEGQEITFIVAEARLLSDETSRKAKAVTISLPDKDYDEEFLFDLFAILNEKSGRCEVFFEIPIESYRLRLHSQPVRIQGSSALETALAARGCRVDWIL